MSIELVLPSNHLVLCHPLLLPSIFPSIMGFSYELAPCVRWPKYLSFSFSISPSNEYSGLISFRTYWFDLLAVQGTLKSLLQHLTLKVSTLWCSVFYGPTLTSIHSHWKNHSLTRQTFVDKVMSLLFNMLPRLVIIFLPRSKHFFNFMAAVIICSDFGHHPPPPPKIKSATVSTASPSIFHEVMGPDAMIFVC